MNMQINYMKWEKFKMTIEKKEKLTQTVTKSKLQKDTSENSGLKKLKRIKPRVSLQDRRHLAFVKDPEGYKGRWVNDEGNRINTFINAGWEILDENGTHVEADRRIQKSDWRQSALSQQVGGGIVAYYMIIPEEWYQADQAKKQAKIDQQENQIRSPQSVGIDPSKTYGEIKINHDKSK